jgi:hypothetical protein
MRWPFHRDRRSWTVIRRRMIAETEVFLQEGLEHPEQHIWIPAKPVGAESWPPAVAAVFWAQLLPSS